MVPGDVMPGGFSLERAPLWKVPNSDWKQIRYCGYDADTALENVAPTCGFYVLLEGAVEPTTKLWIVDSFYDVDGILHHRWRINWYKRGPLYEELYDWTECLRPCRTDPITKWRYWTGTDGQCLPCYVNQGGGTVAVGTQPTSGKMVYEYWSDFWGRYNWHTVRRFHRSSPGGLKAPGLTARFTIRQVREITLPDSQGQPTEYPGPAGSGLLP